ncbi:MAG: TIGR02266 family protein [Myxococcales bacterium]|nr:TIGR02266 family protein [Myxococcales bacterium]
MSLPSDEHESEGEPAGSERRIHPRYETSVKVDYANGDTFLFAYLQNISQMGIFIRTDDPLEVGTNLRLRFPIDGDEPLTLDGEVTWINPYREGGENINPGMGVRFVDLTAERREQVVELVRTVAYLRSDCDESDA